MNEQAPAPPTHTTAATPLAGGFALRAAEQTYRRMLANQPRHFRALCGLAAVRRQLGALDEARRLMGQAVQIAAQSVEDHIVLGTTFVRINDLESAHSQFELAVAHDEEHAEARFHLANVLAGRGHVADAVIQYERALTIDPDHAHAHQNLGTALQQLGHFQSALLHHTAALAVLPKSDLIRVSLGDACRHLDRYDSAIVHYEQALAINPDLIEVHINLGGCFQAKGLRDQAIRCYQQALTIDPGLPDAHYNLGNLYTELDNRDAAIVHYQRSIALRPASAEAHNNLANVLQSRGRPEEAIAHYQEAVRLTPTYLSAQHSLADLLQAQGSIDTAIEYHRAALAIEPRNAATLNRLASALLIAGRLDEASRAFETATDIAPDNVGIQHNYAAVKPFTNGDRRLDRLEELQAREDTLSDEQRIALHFTLGKAHADLKDADRSIHHLHAGNRLKRRHVNYDERRTLTLMQRIGDAFTKDIVEAKSDPGHLSEAPIFVIGMPRSGTSLVEQILASHPRIFGAGEVDHFATATSELAGRRTGPFPEMIGKMSDQDFRELGNIYVERLSAKAPPKDRIVDKLPANFLYAGLIHLALPRARIVHVKRDAVDTCLSCYSLLFAEDQPFAYDLGELGRYYRSYQALMDHWQSVLPPERMLEVRYEDLVEDLEGQARRLLAHCGVEWDKSCLEFHETKRPVQTASLVQVRKSIYASSVGRSRFYGARLAPLVDALEIDDAQAGKPEAWAERTFEAATKLRERGDLSDAEPLFSVVLAMNSRHFGSLLALGSICSVTDRLDDARRYFTQAIAVNENAAEAHGSLGAVCASAGDFIAATACYDKALALAPEHPGIRYAHAMHLRALGRKAEAIEQLRRAVSGWPNHLDGHFALGNLLYAEGQDSEAIECFVRVLQINSRHPEAHNNLANAFQRQGRMERAITHYLAAIEINPTYPDAYGNLGNVYLVLDRLEESIEKNQRALALNPSRFGSHNNQGVAFQALGQFEEAELAFERAVALAPREASVHLNLANMKRFKPGDRRLPGLQKLLSEVESLDVDNQIAAHFAIGKALGDLGQYQDAFRQLLKGNAIKRGTIDYDEPQRLAMFENVRTTFAQDFMKAASGGGDTSWSPIFIVGMPRSGTTLLEQVLASHSKVFGAGELETFKEAIAECVESHGIVPAYPALAAALSRDQIRQLGETYSTRVRARAPTHERIVDKMPLNFIFVGLIHLALPNARFINIRRDPLDNCVSCFSLLFSGSQPFAYDLAELGRYYRGYEAVMEHWHSVLPPGVLIDVKYEDLVDDLEGVARRVLRHCDLDWEDSCRDFHDTKRTVRTASLMQVREPVYRRSIGTWRRYAEFLEPLGRALGIDVRAMSSDI